ncbi:calcium-binding protein [uncultured Brevundimonas sp.]|uniref:EF-hand domain-containing protein n=1 Tax=uncultured Brevundimonas sp. TaxID=213418 RepID=UPI00261020D2|nr:calcium-binding protein [uncultured Brevundimonas sp.]
MKTLFTLAALGLALTASAAAAQSGPSLVEAAFQRADLNNDSALSPAEFGAAREALFARADANGDGRLTLSEARALRSGGGSLRRPTREAIQSLRRIDRNNDRAIDIGEFRALGAQRFAAADLDRDGYIARGEIAAFGRSMGMGD